MTRNNSVESTHSNRNRRDTRTETKGTTRPNKHTEYKCTEGTVNPRRTGRSGFSVETRCLNSNPQVQKLNNTYVKGGLLGTQAARTGGKTRCWINVHGTVTYIRRPTDLWICCPKKELRFLCLCCEIWKWISSQCLQLQRWMRTCF